MVTQILRNFFPFTELADAIEERFGLTRAPKCRASNGRLQIRFRGEGLTDEPVDSRVRHAGDITEMARTILPSAPASRARNCARRAITVVFEDETVINGAVVCTRFSYMAPVPDHSLGAGN